MYGTVARLRARSGRSGRLEKLVEEYRSLDVPGFVSTHILRTDADPDEYYMLVVFEDRASYRANAEDREQDERYRRMRKLLDADPEWHDGEVIAVGGPGA
jgi:heme-degrading monooxygenase HmoA